MRGTNGQAPGTSDPTPARADIAWGVGGAQAAGRRGDVVIVVDVLRFSTAVAAAVASGLYVRPASGGSAPCPPPLRPGSGACKRSGTEERERAWPTTAAPTPKAPLSPLGYAGAGVAGVVEIRSLNGAACVRAAEGAAALYAGSLVNATCVAREAADAAAALGRSITVVACGELWRCAAGGLRMRCAVEDFLGAGAILSRVCRISPRAAVAASRFERAWPELERILVASRSGRELIEGGSAADVNYAAALDSVPISPLLLSGIFKSPGCPSHGR